MLRTLLAGIASLIVMAPATVAHADPTAAEIEAQLQKQGAELETVVEQWNQMNVALADSQAKVASLETDLAAATANAQTIAIESFKSGNRLRNLSVLLRASSSDSLVDQMGTLDQMARRQQHTLDDLKNAKANLNQTLATQTAQKTEIEAKKKSLETDMAKLDQLKKKVNKPPVQKGPPPAVSGKAGLAVTYAYNQIGDPYKFGAAGPDAFDCSGLTMMAWKQAGVTLPHSAAQQWSKVAHISRGDLAAGDLVFYNGLGHVAIYIGGNEVIHAPTSGRTVTRAKVDMGNTIYGYGRVRA
ncbi:NlpC/P60 family protein [Dactylosporangium sp. AC04546]|uniref:C40 family peptidase n=1 Tax=Dactylosporangium sp. AC04546 TaxID=2862460 RepID=UPI001EDFF2E9|nr:C40 family peptidase [Dactylosporangium sp. AC04546]WVK84932.1 NlpC/P60 family protein [Dactylosporangium sp. AC04546]